MADEVCEHNLTKQYDAVSMLCVGDPERKKSTLKGDSGGPLVCVGVPEGIVSWGPINRAFPEVYARVSRFVHWIQTVMKELKPLSSWSLISSLSCPTPIGPEAELRILSPGMGLENVTLQSWEPFTAASPCGRYHHVPWSVLCWD
ncbi:granzyme B-like [Gopherus evgoodei]|uniref:granzyme B-like n=1 Tax=Gopherus evgoodei TaxID=1825980 RepID=UPI0011CF95D4|nr:granzyme B-like [Gopherus evgoodei]